MNIRNDALLIRDVRVLTLDDADREWPRADLVIEGGRIAAIGPDAGIAWPRPFARTINGNGLLAMPGLINAHFHSPGNLMKGSLPGYPLEIFMLHEVPPLAANGDAERLAYVRTMIGALEMLRRGVTAVHDDAYHVPVASVASVDAIMQAYADVGIRALRWRSTSPTLSSTRSTRISKSCCPQPSAARWMPRRASPPANCSRSTPT